MTAADGWAWQRGPAGGQTGVEPAKPGTLAAGAGAPAVPDVEAAAVSARSRRITEADSGGRAGRTGLLAPHHVARIRAAPRVLRALADLADHVATMLFGAPP